MQTWQSYLAHFFGKSVSFRCCDGSWSVDNLLVWQGLRFNWL